MEILEHSLVRIFQNTSKIVGAGFLISKRHILTCAHVIDDVVKHEKNPNEITLTTIRVDFPFVGDNYYLTKVILYRHSGNDDVAILEINPLELPSEIIPARLIDLEKVTPQEIKSYGFPEGYSSGIWTSGMLKGRLANGRIQIEDVKQTGYFIESGFSGSAIVSESLGGVLGMIVTADRDQSRRVAFMIPANRIIELISSHIPEIQSVYYPPIPKKETLVTNILPVTFFPSQIYVADAKLKSFDDISNMLNMKHSNQTEWWLTSGKIISFHNLSTSNWSQICDGGSMEEFDSGEWAYSRDDVIRKEFVSLLNKCLRARVRDDLIFDSSAKYYYFRANRNLESRVFHYYSSKKKTSRNVFIGYSYKGTENPDKPNYYRHSAFSGNFRMYNDAWYLEITPTYHFTTDGYKVHPKNDDFVTNIKKLERNQSIIGQIRMWAYFLSRQSDIFSTSYPFLSFGEVIELDANFGINDDEWLSKDDFESNSNEDI